MSVVMTARLTNEQLQGLADYHRKLAGQFKGPTHQMRNADGQTSFYQLTQTIMAEVYEELLEWRETRPQAITPHPEAKRGHVGL